MQTNTHIEPIGQSLAAQFRVGDLIVHLGVACVTRNAAEVPLPKLSFDLLVALAREAPNIVSIDALMQQVWRVSIVNHETVVQRIKLLRAALGDDPEAPRYIVNVRGRGYRLIAEVACCELARLREPLLREPYTSGDTADASNAANFQRQNRSGLAAHCADVNMRMSKRLLRSLAINPRPIVALLLASATLFSAWGFTHHALFNTHTSYTCIQPTASSAPPQQ